MQVVPRSSFAPNPLHLQSIEDHLLDQECNRLITAKEPLEVTGSEPTYHHLSHPIRLLCSFYHALSQSKPIGYSEKERTVLEETTTTDSLLTHNIKYPLFKLILSAV